MNSGHPAARRTLVAIGLLAFAGSCPAAEPFTVVVLPDTQNYTNDADINDEYGKGQMRWIRDNVASQNIKFVMHVGDLQNPGNPYYARTDNIYLPDFDRPTGYVDTDVRWRRADEAFDILDRNNVPYSIVPGNHDYIRHDIKDEPIYYLQFFGPQRYAGKPTFGGSSAPSPTMKWAGMNTWHKFEGGGYKFLNIALQFDPDDHDLRWAQQVINDNPGVPTIVTTHAYINNSGYQPGYKQLWDKFVRLNPQVVMTVNGHITGEHRHVDQNIADQNVQQMLVDYQATEFPGSFRGGGYLRTMQFDTDANLVRVKSYSPIRDDFLTDGDSQFNFTLNLRNRFGLPEGEGFTSTTRFRQGQGGYTGTRDTYLTAGEPDATHGDETIAWVDGDRDGNTPGQQPSHALIRFDFIFGDGAGQIPDDAAIESATLVLHTSDLSDSQSPNTFSLHRVLKGWTEPNATWNSQDAGISADAADALLGASDTAVPSVAGGLVSFDVTESLFAWLSGAPNNGWALLPGGGNGWRFDTSEAANILFRPELQVTYRSAVPEPTSAALLALATAATALRRGRRK